MPRCPDRRFHQDLGNGYSRSSKLVCTRCGCDNPTAFEEFDHQPEAPEKIHIFALCERCAETWLPSFMAEVLDAKITNHYHEHRAVRGCKIKAYWKSLQEDFIDTYCANHRELDRF